MDARELYNAVKERYPEAAAISVNVSAYTGAWSGMYETYRVYLYSARFSDPTSKITHEGYGRTAEEALEKIEAVKK